MAENATDNIMMIGPSRAGKTTLLSVLRMASSRKLKNAGKVQINPVNPESRELFARARDIVKTGSIQHGATTDPKKYQFQLVCEVEKRVLVESFEEAPGPWPWSAKVRIDKSYYTMTKEDKAFTLNVIDGRGGDIFGERDELEDVSLYNTRRAELIEMAAQSVALVVCVNSSDSKSTQAFFGGLQTFLDDVHHSGKRTPFQRIAIAMTQADRKVEQFGSSARLRLEELDPAAEAAETIGFYARSELFQALEPVARKNVYASWVSVYGFIPVEGSVNFDSKNERIAIYRENDAKWTDDWLPYGVIEPFLFACTGATAGLRQLPEPTE